MNRILSVFSQNRLTIGLFIGAILIVIAGFFGYQKFFAAPVGPLEEVDLTFDAEGPYALLLPRRDGNALVLSLKRTSSYDFISYELAYSANADDVAIKGQKTDEGVSSESIDRGVVGEIDTKQKKGEYEQEILFGTCSKNVCKYDKGVENGTLTLHIRKGRNAYRMITEWHLQQPDVALGVLTSGDSHFVYSIKNAKREELNLVGYTIINDVTGVPKLPDGKIISGKVYALNTPIAKDLMAGDVSIELADNPGSDAKLARYSEKDNKWEELDTKIEGSKLSGKANGAGIFAVLVSKK
jgi:hypothetical protein